MIPLIDEARRAEGAAKEALAAAEKASSALVSSEKTYQELKAALATARVASDQVKPLQDQIARLHEITGRLPERDQLRSQVQEKAVDVGSLEKEIVGLNSDLAKAVAVQADASEMVSSARAAAKKPQYDSELDALLENVRSDATRLETQRASAADVTTQLACSQKTVRDLAAKLESRQKDAELAKETSIAATQRTRAAEDSVSHAHRLDMANHLRESLEPGGACPVCEQHVDTAPKAVTDARVESAKAELVTARHEEEQATKVAQESRAALSVGQSKLEAESRHHAELEARHSDVRKSVQDVESKIRHELGKHAPDQQKAIEEWVNSEVASVATKRREHAAAQKQLEQAENELQEAKTSESISRLSIKNKNETAARVRRELSRARDRLRELEVEIKGTTEADDPTGEAKRLKRRMEEIGKSLETARAREAEARSLFVSSQQEREFRIEAMKKTRDGAASRCKQRDKTVADAGFENAKSVVEAVVDDATLLKLKERVDGHVQDLRAAERRIRDLKADLGDVRVSDDQLGAARDREIAAHKKSDALLKEMTRLSQQIGDMRGRLMRLKERQQELDAKEKGNRLYGRLANDLRSDKFQSYVLQDVFTELVRGASIRLLQLTSDRYSLQFDDDQIVVVDHDNASETRSSDTLSGGETFLASLSLALELSNQVQRVAGAVNLDSLFIDEGFGTLDPDSLAVVAETIQSLQVGGRMVGIITHIPELRDEFQQRILVHKQQGSSRVEVRVSE
ncbi:MAG: SMC family ATPase [Pirellulaceae bacterium]|nr:SMC family ATPase [Pirellulaceae bacterium]